MNFFQKKIVIKELIHYLAVIIAIFGILFFINKIRNEEININEVFTEVIKNKNLILIELLLFILNFSLETFRWKTLYRNVENISFGKSLKTVLIATAFGNSTPGGLGEHIARINGKSEVSATLVISIIASLLQTTTITLFAVVAFTAVGILLEIKILKILSLVILLILLVFLIIRRIVNKKENSKLINSILRFNRKQLVTAFTFNIFRYVVFSFQLFLLLNSFDEKLDLEIMVYIPIYYFIITIIPVQRILDIGIKGSVALYVFGNLLEASQISFSILFIWLLNTLLPSILGISIFFYSLLRNKKRTCN